MSELNKDGLKPGQIVDFATLQRVKHEQLMRSKNAKPTKKPSTNKGGKGKAKEPVQSENGDSEQSGVSGGSSSDAE